MKKLTIFLTLFISMGFSYFNTTVYATDVQWRCSNLFVKAGVHSFKVLEHCGEPKIKRGIGYSGSQSAGVTREKWVYGPYSGYYYVIYMKAGVVDKVEPVRHDD